MSHYRTSLLAAIFVHCICWEANAGEASAEVYHSRYTLGGFLLRAAGVCHDDRILNAGFALLNTAELKEISITYTKTVREWMDEGAMDFIKEAMTNGVDPACAYAVAMRKKAEEINNGGQ